MLQHKMKPEDTVSEISIRKRQIPYDITYIGILENETNELIYTTESDSQKQKTNLGLPKGKEWGEINQEFGINRYTLLYIKQITNMDLLYSTENTTQYFIITYKGKNLKKNRYVYMYNGITLLYT